MVNKGNRVAKKKKETKRSKTNAKKVAPILMEGAQALVTCLEQQGVEYIFGLSGGAAIPIFDAIIKDLPFQGWPTNHALRCSAWK